MTSEYDVMADEQKRHNEDRDDTKLDRDDLVEIIYQSNQRGGLDTAGETLCDVLAGLVTILQQEGYWRAVPVSVLRALAEPDEEDAE